MEERGRARAGVRGGAILCLLQRGRRCAWYRIKNINKQTGLLTAGGVRVERQGCMMMMTTERERERERVLARGAWREEERWRFRIRAAARAQRTKQKKRQNRKKERERGLLRGICVSMRARVCVRAEAEAEHLSSRLWLRGEEDRDGFRDFGLAPTPKCLLPSSPRTLFCFVFFFFSVSKKAT